MEADIVADIDATLNELMQIADALKTAKLNHHEVDALEKMQESLLARLMHRQSLLDMENRKRTLDSLRKEAVEKKVVEYARNQKRAKVRSARSKS